MELQPITYDDACDFVRKQHCGQIPPQGWKFGIAVNNGEKVVGVITVGRPAAHYKDDGLTLEVTLCCTDGTREASQRLYTAAWQATKSLGYKNLITYTQISESGNMIDETKHDESEGPTVSQEERATLNSILMFPDPKKADLSDIDRLQIQLTKAKKVFQKLGCKDWEEDVSRALGRLNCDDFSFLEELWLKFARDVDNLVLIAPQLHDPPMSEEEADRLNGELADVANATFAALDKIKDTRKALISGLP